MVTPVRLQLSRRKGFDLQALSRATNGLPAIKVTRPGAWGNPYVVWRDGPAWMVSAVPCHWGPFRTFEVATAEAVCLFRDDLMRPGHHHHRLNQPVPTAADIIKSLRGMNLACWCKPGAPCHADVLLELANRPICEAVA
ncbi:MAG: hypothetical protein DI527_00860 [Chelatococcus sp.]|nr:MAG: hypothetical protein DI527_00860 [Chelatococcus sp.]